MSEYGHTGIRIPGGFMDIWGGQDFSIVVGGKTYRFEDSDRFGPSWITAKGDIAKRQPGDGHPFWGAYTAWRKQGRRMNGNQCIWDPFKDEILEVAPNGKIIRVIQEGENGGLTIIVRPTPKDAP